MITDSHLKKLLGLARDLPPSDHVPYAFEKRIMARLTSPGVPDAWAVWSRLLWRAAAPCVGVMLVLTVWSAVSTHSSNSSDTLAADFERTVWGPLDSIRDTW
jgi:hypothetical protein